LMSLTSNWYLFKIRSSFLTSFSINWLVLVVYSNIYPNCNPNQKYFGQQNSSLTSPKDANAHDIWPM
jgi:hypothetical protein